MASEAPNEWQCPLTCQLMIDPVIGSDGYTYERSAIETWLRTHPRSPMTRQPMTVDQLIPNRALKDTIEAAIAAGTVAAPDSPDMDAVVTDATAAADANLPARDTVPTRPGFTVRAGAMGPARDGKAGEQEIMLTLEPAATGSRAPTAFIAVLDVSGSMCLPAAERNADNVSFSRLDLVKHSMATVVSMLEEQDALAIIPFHTSARIDLPVTTMNAAGRAAAMAAINNLEPLHSTNLWDGLRLGLEMAQSPAIAGRQVSLLVLSDGESNVDPPRGLIPTLALAMNGLTGAKPEISTFGFGYDVESPALVSVARVGNGSFAFIPDASMVGTVFVNYLASRLAAANWGLHVALQPADGVELACPATREVTLLQFGARFDMLVRVKAGDVNPGQELVRATVTSVSPSDEDEQCVSVTWRSEPEQAADGPAYELAQLRTQLCAVLQTACTHRAAAVSTAPAQLKALHEKFSSLTGDGAAAVAPLLSDLDGEDANSGQIGKAVSREDWWTKWGCHYLPSVMFAHEQQICNNFKDAGVQQYGGELFRQLQSAAEAKFCQIPPPTPSERCPPGGLMVNPGGARFSGASYRSSSSASRAAPVSMARFMNAAGGCFAAACPITMADGSIKLASAVRAGDLVRSVAGSPARVVCVVHTAAQAGMLAPLVRLPGEGTTAQLTPWHPARYVGGAAAPGTWHFPVQLAAQVHAASELVVNFVLATGHAVRIGEYEAVTLGHGVTDDAVASHAYFGTPAVLHDLEKAAGWESGFVELTSANVIRDDESGHVVCWRWE